jgi:hypothetical protein
MKAGGRYYVAAGILVVASGMLLAAGALNPVKEHQKTPIAIPLAEFPREIAGWVGEDQELSEEELKFIQPDDYVRRIYRRGGDVVVFYVVYHGNKLEGLKRVHHTATICLPRARGGWREQADWNRKESVVFNGPAKSIPMSTHYFTGEGGADWLVTVFFSVDGKLEAVHRQPKKAPIDRLYDRVTERFKGPGYCIQVQVWTPGNGDPRGGYELAKGFLQDAMGTILRHFPAEVEE